MVMACLWRGKGEQRGTKGNDAEDLEGGRIKDPGGDEEVKFQEKNP